HLAARAIARVLNLLFAFRSPACRMLDRGVAVRRFAVVGNSHVLTLFEGYQLIARELPACELTFIAKGRHKIGQAVAGPSGIEWPDPGGDLVERVARLDVADVFVMWRGSQVNIRGLLQQGPAFDVVLPDDPDRAFDPDIELIPCSAIESVVRSTLDTDEELL